MLLVRSPNTELCIRERPAGSVIPVSAAMIGDSRVSSAASASAGASPQWISGRPSWSCASSIEPPGWQVTPSTRMSARMPPSTRRTAAPLSGPAVMTTSLITSSITSMSSASPVVTQRAGWHRPCSPAIHPGSAGLTASRVNPERGIPRSSTASPIRTRPIDGIGKISIESCPALALSAATAGVTRSPASSSLVPNPASDPRGRTPVPGSM